MNKEYERVQEKIVTIFNDLIVRGWGDITEPETRDTLASLILSIKGVAILSDDQSLPRAMPHFISSNSLDDKVLFAQYKQSQQDMLKADFVKVVKGEK